MASTSDPLAQQRALILLLVTSSQCASSLAFDLFSVYNPRQLQQGTPEHGRARPYGAMTWNHPALFWRLQRGRRNSDGFSQTFIDASTSLPNIENSKFARIVPLPKVPVPLMPLSQLRYPSERQTSSPLLESGVGSKPHRFSSSDRTAGRVIGRRVSAKSLRRLLTKMKRISEIRQALREQRAKILAEKERKKEEMTKDFEDSGEESMDKSGETTRLEKLGHAQKAMMDRRTGSTQQKLSQQTKGAKQPAIFIDNSGFSSFDNSQGSDGFSNPSYGFVTGNGGSVPLKTNPPVEFEPAQGFSNGFSSKDMFPDSSGFVSPQFSNNGFADSSFQDSGFNQNSWNHDGSLGGFLESPPAVDVVVQALDPEQRTQFTQNAPAVVSSNDVGGWGSIGETRPSQAVSDGFEEPAYSNGQSAGFGGSAGDFWGFGQFSDDNKDCATISSTKMCRSNQDCSCNGFYTCRDGHCALLQDVNTNVPSADDGDMWHDAPIQSLL